MGVCNSAANKKKNDENYKFNLCDYNQNLNNDKILENEQKDDCKNIILNSSDNFSKNPLKNFERNILDDAPGIESKNPLELRTTNRVINSNKSTEIESKETKFSSKNDNYLTINNTEIECTYFGKIFNNPFEIHIYNTIEKLIYVQRYEALTIIDSCILNIRVENSSYCNGNNHLYVSEYKNFWNIDLDTKKINFMGSISEKKNHSMIYIPDKYIFFIGGDDLTCFYFDLLEGKEYNLPELNKINKNPPIINCGHSLYCFQNENNNCNQIYIEKLDLLKNYETKNWSIIIPKIDSGINTNTTFSYSLSLCKLNDNNILLFGGTNNNMSDKSISKINEKNYTYDIKENLIKINNIKFNDFKTKEKKFFKINKNEYALLADYRKNYQQIVIYNNLYKKITIIEPKPFEIQYPKKVSNSKNNIFRSQLLLKIRDSMNEKSELEDPFNKSPIESIKKLKLEGPIKEIIKDSKNNTLSNSENYEINNFHKNNYLFKSCNFEIDNKNTNNIKPNESINIKKSTKQNNKVSTTRSVSLFNTNNLQNEI